MDTNPYWVSQAPRKFPALARNLDVDAVVVGGGLAGISAAYQLKRAGLKVALVESGHCTQGETGHTTGHLAVVTDLTFRELSKRFGSQHAQAVWDAGFAAIHEIDETIRREHIDCDFMWTEGYLHTTRDGESSKEVRELQDEARCVSAAGFDAEFMESIPGLARPGIRFDHQAKFHPLKYASALVECIDGGGSHVFERTEVADIKDGDRVTVAAGKHVITASYLVIATHIPLPGKTGMVKGIALQTDLFQYTTYAVRAKIRKGLLPDAM